MDQFEIQVGTNKKDAFEGWFVKVDDEKNDLLFSVIWGYSTKEEDAHCFLQFTNSLTHETKYFSYSLHEMKIEKDPFVVHMGKNSLSAKKMVLDLKEESFEGKGELFFGSWQEIKKSKLRPNIMGPITYFPNECNHSITSMYHTVKGNLFLNGKNIFIENAKGYMEKDWGTSFPEKYVWAQANGEAGDSIVFSYATVPVLGKSATGFFLVLHYKGEEFRFSSIEGAKGIEFQPRENGFFMEIQKRKERVQLECTAYHPVNLKSPHMGGMSSTIKESLDGELSLWLKKNNGEEIVFVSKRTSMDIHYPIEGKFDK